MKFKEYIVIGKYDDILEEFRKELKNQFKSCEDVSDSIRIKIDIAILTILQRYANFLNI